MGTAKKMPSGRWQIQVYLGRTPDGKTINKTITADTKKEANRKAALYLLEGNKPTRDTMGFAMDEYILFKTPILSPSTVRGYKHIAKALKKDEPVFCATKLHIITDVTVQGVLNRVATAHTPKTVRNYNAFISAVLHFKKIRVEPRNLPQRVRPEINVPTEEVARKVFEAIKGTSLEVPVLLAACGLRRGEICALTPDDFCGDVVHVSRDMVMNDRHEWVTKPPKTFTSDRYVKVPQDVGEKVRKQGYVTRYNPNSLTGAHRRKLKAIGVDHFRLHDWRHFMVSRLHEKGCSDAFIMRYGGWSSEYTMKNVYRHTLADYEQKMADVAVGSLAELLP